MTGDQPHQRDAEEDPGDITPDAPDPVAMTDVPVLAPEPIISLSSHPFHAVLLQMAEPIVDEVRAEIPAYSGPKGGRRHKLMMMAANAAVHGYLDTRHRASAQRKVDELFHRMGWGEAADAATTDNLEAALSVASRAAWRHLSDYAVARGYSAKALRDVIDELVVYADHLRGELLAGHALRAGRPPQAQGQRARQDLLQLFLTSNAGRVSPVAPLGIDHLRLVDLAGRAGWPVPEQVVALAISFHGESPELPQEPDVLWIREGNRIQLLCPAPMADELAARIERSGSDRRVVVSWPVSPVEAGTALLWTLRAMDLVHAGVISPTTMVRCEEHVTQLWLHSEPSMRRRLCQDLLQPLLAEAPNSREILSETLLVWLETRDSAPAIAARLDIHPQTVRYRWRRINELFGEALHDPEFVIQMTLVLKASVPMWKGGDQSDFELFRDTRDAAG